MLLRSQWLCRHSLDVLLSIYVTDDIKQGEPSSGDIQVSMLLLLQPSVCICMKVVCVYVCLQCVSDPVIVWKEEQ